jgi:nucleolar protein 4
MPASARVQQPDRPTQDDSPAMDLDSPAGTSSSATMTTASLSKQEPGTLFVRNLALTTTKEELVSYFSEIGPVKRGIVVCEKKSQGGASKGFGFVVFALASDADEAIRLLKDQAELQGRKLALDVAGPKGVKRPLQDSSLKRISLPAPAATAGEPQPSSAPGLSAPAALDDSEDADKRAVILFNLPEDFSDKQLQIRLRKSERKVLQVERDGSRARVLFETPGAAHAAVQELDKRTWGGGLVFARRPQQMATKSRAMGRCRLIVRNLGFKVNEPRLRQAFELHGPVSDVVVSRGEDGKSRGFGFVQFVCRQDAEKAVQALNGEVSLGPAGKDRPVAVDFCLAKHRYELLKRLATAPAEDGAAKEDGGAAESGKESEEEEEEEEGKPQAAAAALPKRDSGVSQGRTLFVQNLLFETTEDVVRTRFREFGPVRGVKMVRDAQGRSKGTAFVEFWEQATCAKAMQAPMPLMLEGRPVYASLAVDKATAERLTSKEEKPAKSDKRHMYLAAEGRVSVEDVPKGDRAKRASAEAEKKDKLKSPMFFVSPTRLSVRNLNRKAGTCISCARATSSRGSRWTGRASHRMGRATHRTGRADEVIDSKELKKLALDAAVRGLKQGVVKDNEGDRTLFPAPGIQPWPKVLKATVFFEDDAKTSRGFGFVEFSEHIHALAALRVLNNTPDFGWAAAGGRAAMKVKDEDRPVGFVLACMPARGGGVAAHEHMREPSG